MIKLLVFLLCIPFAFAATDQVLVLDLHFNEGEITLANSTLKYGFAPDRRFQPEYGYELEIWSDKKLHSFTFKEPNIEYREGTENNQLRGGIFELSEVNFALIVPYYEDMQEIRIYSPQDKPVSTIEFEHPKENNRWLMLGVILLATLLLVTGYLFFKYVQMRRSL